MMKYILRDWFCALVQSWHIPRGGRSPWGPEVWGILCSYNYISFRGPCRTRHTRHTTRSVVPPPAKQTAQHQLGCCRSLYWRFFSCDALLSGELGSQKTNKQTHMQLIIWCSLKWGLAMCAKQFLQWHFKHILGWHDNYYHYFKALTLQIWSWTDFVGTLTLVGKYYNFTSANTFPFPLWYLGNICTCWMKDVTWVES